MSSGINLRKLNFSPKVNPLITVDDIALRDGLVRTGIYSDLVNQETGGVDHTSVIHKKMELDDEHFVKMYAAGLSASFELSKTSQKVLSLVLTAYQRSPMSGGFSDWVELFWADLVEETAAHIGISEKTFQRGLKDLIARRFLAPRKPGTYWTNPHLFFKGNRVLFVNEFRRKSKDGVDPADKIKQEEIPY